MAPWRPWPTSSRAFKPEGGQGHVAGNIVTGLTRRGSSAVLIMSEEKANALGLRPRARFHTFALAGVDPVTMLTGPDPGQPPTCSSGPS